MASPEASKEYRQQAGGRASSATPTPGLVNHLGCRAAGPSPFITQCITDPRPLRLLLFSSCLLQRKVSQVHILLSGLLVSWAFV